MADNLPYVTSVGTLEKLLEKIKSAVVPERFTQDFLATVLAMKGGRPQSLIPFMKKMGFLARTGEPTQLYKEFKNPSKSGKALAKGFKELYSRLYEKNEFVEAASDKDVRGLIIECTGADEEAATVKYTLSTFKLLKKLSDFSPSTDNELDHEPSEGQNGPGDHMQPQHLPQISLPPKESKGINLSYTINLNLPPTKDVEVFNAIFKSLKKHLLEG